jgi:cytochrome oxidase Cu insertion factor (SCO1/SenC/PrrC family)/thiol-disulfide isomerase/thioredoxin
VSGERLRTVRLVLVALAAVLAVVLVTVGLLSRPARSTGSALAENPDLDAGTALYGQAPKFTLTDQLGRRVSLSSLHGQVVLLAFTDSQCTTVCPLTTTEILDAKRLLGAAGARVQLLGIDANPTATTIGDVRAYSRAHGMMSQWHFLTGSLSQLRSVWRAYHIDVQIEQGQIDHTPALYVIDTHGRLARVYLTEMAYAGIEQQAQLLAQEASSLLPGHPPVRSSLAYTTIKPIAPTVRAQLPLAAAEAPSNGSGVNGTDSAGTAWTGGATNGKSTDGTAATAAADRSGSVPLGPNGAPRLYLFFDTWDSEVGDLRAQLQALDRYVTMAASSRGPALTAIDEGTVEPSPAALPALLRSLARPLNYPVAIDRTGRVADGYEVEDEPWLVLVSAKGRILWHYDISTSGWPTTAALARDVRSALAHPLPPPPKAIAVARRKLAGSPPALAALHAQAGQLVGSSGALMARLHELRGYPVVLNVWASWCTPCQAEFPLFAAASAMYGRRVAFLGADVEDSPGPASSFLAEHPVSYPSYATSLAALRPLALVGGIPTTIFIDSSGRVTHVHIGQYGAQGSLDEDVGSDAA